MAQALLFAGTGVAIEGRALLIEGAAGTGKSSLALALIDRGAALIGDDGVSLTRRADGAVAASPPPNIAGLLEVRGVGLVTVPATSDIPVSLILSLDAPSQRLPEKLEMREFMGAAIPVLPFRAGTTAPAERALWALRIHGM